MSCNSSDQPTYCSSASPELKLYQAFIFSVPVFFTLILLLLFFAFYLRQRRASWQSMRMRASTLGRGEIPRCSDPGIKKEVREMLPVVVFKESFLIRETLGKMNIVQGMLHCFLTRRYSDYQSDERLQRIPSCGHTFHIDCIDHWLATHTTCPLCRVSLLPAAKPTADQLDHEDQASESQLQEQSSESSAAVRISQQDNEADERERVRGTVGEVQEIRNYGEGSVVINIEGHSNPEENPRV